MDARRARKNGFRKIGEAAALFSTTPRTLLYYEELGILAPCKTTKGTRMYSEADLRVFATAQELSSLGVPLRKVRDLVSISRTDLQSNDVASRQALILGELAGKLRNQIQRIDLIAADIEAVRDLLHEKGSELTPSELDEATERLHCIPERTEASPLMPQIVALLQPGQDMAACPLLSDETFEGKSEEPARISRH
ncbi:MerR family transcriptional regulator [Fulvimarina sp. MAC3]|uniref:MerR family transcriptional regulator n=1 Tax=Fulvimarina sp. MAC3 TaxID=3148887 RepID=UPI0031FDF5AC